MQKYGVAAYLHGHMHNFQHHFLDGMHYINAGHGSDLASQMKPRSPPGLLFNKTIGGFARMHVGSTNLMVYFIDENGKCIYNAQISNSRRRRRMAALAAAK
jgi:predicted phosphodiesterase